MEEFDFKLQHRAGLAHGNADSLSRKIPCEEAGGPCPQCHKLTKRNISCFGVQTIAQRRLEAGNAARNQPEPLAGAQPEPLAGAQPEPLAGAQPVTSQPVTAQPETSEPEPPQPETPQPAPAVPKSSVPLRPPSQRKRRAPKACCDGGCHPSWMEPSARGHQHKKATPEVESVIEPVVVTAEEDMPDPSSPPVINAPESNDNVPLRDDQMVEDALVSKKGKRKNKRNQGIERSLNDWTDVYIAEEQAKDTSVGEARQWIIDSYKPDWHTVRGCSPQVKAYWHQYNSLYIRNDVLYRRLEPERPSDEPICQLVLPAALRAPLMQAVHEGIAGHLGASKTKAHISNRAYWYLWRRDVDIFCRKCDDCSEYNRSRLPPRQGKLVPMVLGAPVERWSIDLAGKFPQSSAGYVYIMTAICAFSKFIVLVPLRDKTAMTVATAIYDYVFLKYGAGEILNELCRLMGVARAFTTAYEARTNAVVNVATSPLILC